MATGGLIKKLRWMKQEVRALKEAHEHALGVISFYFTEEVFEIPVATTGDGTWTLTATLSGSGVFPAIVQLAMESDDDNYSTGEYGFAYTSNSVTYTLYKPLFSNSTVTVHCWSSAQLTLTAET